MQKLLCGLALLLLILTAQPIYSQTLYMGENSAGVGVQYQYASISGQPFHTYLFGVSLKRKFDISVAFSEASSRSMRQNNAFRAVSSTIQLTFFPTMEKNGQNSFSTELVAGVGTTQVNLNSGFVMMVGAGISKATHPQNTNTLSMRPRFSAASTYTRIGTEPHSEFAQENIGVSIAVELLIDVRLNDTAALIFTPSMGYYTNEHTTGYGLSASFVF